VKRFLLLALAVVIIAAVIRQGRARRNEWHGLTEAEARARLEQRFPGVIPEERRDAMTDTIVSKMRDRGVLVDDAAPSTDETIDLTTPDAVSSPTPTPEETTTA
jgi:hypothetical protein